MPDDPDVDDVIQEQTKGWRNPAAFLARKERARQLWIARRALRARTEREYAQALRDLGIRDGTPEFSEKLAEWHRFH